MSILVKFFQFLFGRSIGNAQTTKVKYEQDMRPGAFLYDEAGFVLVYKDFEKRLNWVDITQLNVYKIDQLVVDRINMEIVYGDRCLTIHEDLPGWNSFVQRTKDIFPSIPKDWDLEIILPPFATNYRTIYDKGK